MYLGGDNSNIFYVHPLFGGRWTQFDKYFSKGLVQPPTRYDFQHIYMYCTYTYLSCTYVLHSPRSPESDGSGIQPPNAWTLQKMNGCNSTRYKYSWYIMSMTSITSLLGCTQNTRRLQKQQNMLRSQSWRKGMVSSDCVSLLLAIVPLSIRTLQLPQSEMIPQRLQTTGISGILVNVFFKPPDPAFQWSFKMPAHWTPWIQVFLPANWSSTCCPWSQRPRSKKTRATLFLFFRLENETYVNISDWPWMVLRRQHWHAATKGLELSTFTAVY